MIKKIQKRFILLTMSALFLVLFTIIAGINIVNYKSIVKDADQLLSILAENNGIFPEIKKEDPGRRPPGENIPDINPPKSPETDRKPFLFPGILSEETPYETRYFSVLIDSSSGTVLETETEHIASVTEETLTSYTKEINGQKNTSGFVDSFRYIRLKEDSAVRIIFLDCSRQLNAFQTFILISTGISLLGFAIVTVIIIFFSNRIIRPISESYEKQKRFITDASHEIKTPLTIINADADILEMELDENEWISDIKHQTKRLTELTNNLILLARMEESDNSITKIEFPISDVITEAVLSFQSLAQTQNKFLHADIQPILSMRGDSKRIHQLATLLLDNAVKYSPENSGIFITLSKSPKSKAIQLTITNQTAYPLTEEHLHSMFDRFYRADSSRNSSTGGYGIGLSVAKAIVDSHGGKIKALSEKESTVTIHVHLPI